MEPVNLSTKLDTLAALRLEYADLPATKLAAILRYVPATDLPTVQSMLAEYEAREGQLKGELADLEVLIKTQALATGELAYGTHLQVIVMPGRVTYDRKAMDVYSTLHPEVRAYRKEG